MHYYIVVLTKYARAGPVYRHGNTTHVFGENWLKFALNQFCNGEMVNKNKTKQHLPTAVVATSLAAPAV